MNREFDILCFGSITLDVFLKTSEPLCRQVDGSDSFCFPVGAKYSLQNAHEMSGGGAANTSVGFAKLGMKSACIGVVGQDDKRDLLAHQMEKFGVNTDHMVVAEGQQTSMSLIFTTRDGRRTAFTHKAKTDKFNKNSLLNAPSAKAIYVSHINNSAEEILFAIAEWKTMGKSEKLVAWNPGKKQFKKGIQYFEKICPFVDLLVLNVEEAEMFLGISALWQRVSDFGGEVLDKEYFKIEKLVNGAHLAAGFLDLGIKKVIITDGKRGAQYFDQSGAKYWIPSKEKSPKNTLGAGDAFSVGAVWALAKGLGAQKMLKAGSLNAWSTIQAFGAQRGQLSQRQMEKFL